MSQARCVGLRHASRNARIARSRLRNNRFVSIRVFRRIVVVISALVWFAGASLPAQAAVAAPARCDTAQAAKFRAAADRYAAHGQYADAAAWYLAATHATSECRTPDDTIARATSLFAAGTALALNGDFLRGLGLLQTAQSQLTAVAASGDPIMAPKARAILDLIASVIGEIDTVARGSM